MKYSETKNVHSSHYLVIPSEEGETKNVKNEHYLVIPSEEDEIFKKIEF
jgi:hypothetical protein